MYKYIAALVVCVTTLANAGVSESIPSDSQSSHPSYGKSIHYGGGDVYEYPTSILQKNGRKYIYYSYKRRFGANSSLLKVEANAKSFVLAGLPVTKLVDVWEEDNAVSLLLVHNRGYLLMLYDVDSDRKWGRGHARISNNTISMERFDDGIKSIALTSLYDVEMIRNDGAENIIYSVASGKLLENGKKPLETGNRMIGSLPDLTSKKKIWTEFDPADQEALLKKVDKPEEALVESAKNDVANENWHPIFGFLVGFLVLGGIFTWRYTRGETRNKAAKV